MNAQSPTPRKVKRNSYLVLIPLDFIENKKNACEQAIIEAKERARLYYIPARWEAKHIRKDGMNHRIRVYRFHY